MMDDQPVVCVAWTKSDQIVQVDRNAWKVSRTMATGRGVYNLAVAPDGRTKVATLKQGAGRELFDLKTGESVAQLRTSNAVSHGEVVVPRGACDAHNRLLGGDRYYAAISAGYCRAESSGEAGEMIAVKGVAMPISHLLSTGYAAESRYIARRLQ